MALRIAITADPELPVPPLLYGGIERVIDMLIHGLLERGHHVTLLANPASSVTCDFVPYLGARSDSFIDTLRNTATIFRTVTRGNFDLVHSFGRVAYLLPLLPISMPKLMTYQRPISPTSVSWGHRLSQGSLHFSAISQWMLKDVGHLASWNVVYNGVALNAYDFVPTSSEDAPLAFLGRIEHIKGTHLAIEVAKATGRKLVIAGNIPAGHENYFEMLIEPQIDGDQISYVGAVNDSQKSVLLGSAAALLMPILWDEPFGIVMAEAMACGTPVLGLRRGAVPEVVQDGICGFVRDTIVELADMVTHLPTLSRHACRARAEQFFSEDVIVEDYLNVYRRIISN